MIDDLKTIAREEVQAQCPEGTRLYSLGVIALESADKALQIKVSVFLNGDCFLGQARCPDERDKIPYAIEEATAEIMDKTRDYQGGLGPLKSRYSDAEIAEAARKGGLQ